MENWDQEYSYKETPSPGGIKDRVVETRIPDKEESRDTKDNIIHEFRITITPKKKKRQSFTLTYMFSIREFRSTMNHDTDPNVDRR